MNAYIEDCRKKMNVLFEEVNAIGFEINGLLPKLRVAKEKDNLEEMQLLNTRAQFLLAISKNKQAEFESYATIVKMML